MSYLSASETQRYLDSLLKNYEAQLDNKRSLESDCQKLRELIQGIISRVQDLNKDFEKLKDEYDSRNTHKEEQKGGNKKNIQILNGASQKMSIDPIIIIKLYSYVASTAFSPDGCFVAAGSDKYIRVCDINKGTVVLDYSYNPHEDHHFVRAISWTGDGKYLVCGDECGFIRVFNFPTKSTDDKPFRTFESTGGCIYQMQCSHSNKFFATVNGGGIICLYDLPDFSLITTAQSGERNASSLSINESDSLIAVGYSNGLIHIYNIAKNQFISTVKVHEKEINSLLFIPLSNKIVTSSFDNTIKIWNYVDENDHIKLSLWKQISDHESLVLSLSTDSEGKWLLSGSKDNSFILTELKTGNPIYKVGYHTDSILTVSFARHGSIFCTGSGDKAVIVWKFTVVE